MTRAKEFKRIGVDAVFVEALPDRDAMSKCVRELDMPVFANSESFVLTCSHPCSLSFSNRGWQDGESFCKGSC